MIYLTAMSQGDDISDLIARTALQDRAAFQALYQRTSAKLFGVCLRILNDRSEAEDVLQEVYVKVWNKADRFATGQASGIAWLAAIARNQSIDRLRARKPMSEPESVLGELASDDPSPEDAVISGSENQRIEGCLEELDERHAAAVKRTYLAGWSYQQAADELEVPLNTVKTWIRRSLLSLRECMNR